MNTTLLQSGARHQAPPYWNPAIYDSAKFSKHEPTLFHLCLFLCSFFYFYQNGFRSYGHRQFWNSNTLLFHAVSGVAELALFYYRTYTRAPLEADRLALCLCLVQCMTNLQLVKHLRKGHSYIVRPSYQAGAITRSVSMLWAYMNKSPTTYTTAIMPLHAFPWARLFFTVFSSMGTTRNFKHNINSDEVYTLAIFGSAVIATGTSSEPYAVFAYIVVFWAIGMLSKKVRSELDRCEEKGLVPDLWVSVMVKVGFYAFKCSPEEKLGATKLVNKGPLIGDLAGDAMGVTLCEFGIHIPEEVEREISCQGAKEECFGG